MGGLKATTNKGFWRTCGRCFRRRMSSPWRFLSCLQSRDSRLEGGCGAKRITPPLASTPPSSVHSSEASPPPPGLCLGLFDPLLLATCWFVAEEEECSGYTCRKKDVKITTYNLKKMEVQGLIPTEDRSWRTCSFFCILGSWSLVSYAWCDVVWRDVSWFRVPWLLKEVSQLEVRVIFEAIPLYLRIVFIVPKSELVCELAFHCQDSEAWSGKEPILSPRRHASSFLLTLPSLAFFKTRIQTSYLWLNKRILGHLDMPVLTDND